MAVKIEGKNIFVTGGTGFIGSWLINALADRNRIWCYDNCRRVSPKFGELARHKHLAFTQGDILDGRKLKRSLPKKIDMVVHLAAIAGVSSYYRMPFETMSINLIGTYNLLEAVKGRDLDAFLDFSTSEVYGKHAKNVSEESDTTQGPLSDLRWTYGISKLAAEELSHCYHHKYGLPVVSVRPFNVYGPLQIGEGAIQIFTKKALAGEDIVVHGDGSQVRAWCYIEDFIDGVLRCMAQVKRTAGNTFNIGNDRAVATTIELARIVVALAGSGSRIRFEPMAHKDIEYRVPDISKVRAMTGYAPKVGLKEGLRRTIAWCRDTMQTGALARRSMRTKAAGCLIRS